MKGETSGTQYYEGIRVRATPPQVTYPSQTAVGTNTAPITAVNATPVKVLPVQQRTIKSISPAPDSTALDNPASGPPRIPAPASPILKAQLSAPPKPPSNTSNTTNQSQNPVTKVDSKSQVGPNPSFLPFSLPFMTLVLILVMVSQCYYIIWAFLNKVTFCMPRILCTPSLHLHADK